MSYDGLVTRAVSLELNNLLYSARIDKVYQPGRKEIILQLRKPGHNFKLYLSSQAQEAGAFLTTQKKDNPQTPPLFCMVLRKHLEGGRIISVKQDNLERFITISCEATNEMGDKVRRDLIIEIMGKHSNIILTNPEKGLIIDAIQKVTDAVSRYRQILPGLFYQTPPPQDKLLPWSVEEESFKELILNSSLTQTVKKSLLNTYQGFSPQSIEEIIFRAGLEPTLTVEYCGDYECTKLWLAFKDLVAKLQQGIFAPEVVLDGNTPLGFSAIALTQYNEEMRKSFPSINEALDLFFSFKNSSNIFRQKVTHLNQLIKKEVDRCEKKAGLQMESINNAEKSEHYRLWGKLLTANIHTLPRGKEARVVNFYDQEAKTIDIPLNETLTISDNAQRFFKLYQKAKHTAKQAAVQLQETQNELAYLYSLSNSLEQVTDLQELYEIEEELRDSGYLKTTPKKGKKKTDAPEKSTPVRIILESFDIYIGKNNKQNDLLTMKMGKPSDLWLHTKDIPGSHVLIRNPNDKIIPNEVLEAAALLAAYHSKARHATNIPVDYTQKKHVWKQKGAKPGMVNYDNQRTIFVTPDEDTIKNIMKSIDKGTSD